MVGSLSMTMIKYDNDVVGTIFNKNLIVWYKIIEMLFLYKFKAFGPNGFFSTDLENN